MHKIVKGLALAGCFLFAHCVEAKSTLTVSEAKPAKLSNPGDLASIFKRGYLQVAMVADLPPFTHIVKNEAPTGLDVELIKAMAKTMGVNAKIYVVPNPRQLLPWVEKGFVDLSISNIPMTVASTQKVYFAKPYLTANYAMLVNRYRAEKLGLTNAVGSYDRKSCRLGYVGGKTNVPMLKYPFPKAKKIRFSYYPKALAALKDGKIDALFSDSITLKYYYTKNPMNAFTQRLIILSGFYKFSAIAQRFSSLMLGGWITYFIQSMYADKDSLLSYAKGEYHFTYQAVGKELGVNDEKI